MAVNVSLLSSELGTYESRRRTKRPRSAIKFQAQPLSSLGPTMGTVRGGWYLTNYTSASHRQLADWCSGYHVSFTASEYSPTRSPVRSRGWSLEALLESFTFSTFEIAFFFSSVFRLEHVSLASVSSELGT